MGWACWEEGRERLGEEMNKDECDRSGGLRCSEENVEELGGERHELEGYGFIYRNKLTEIHFCQLYGAL